MNDEDFEETFLKITVHRMCDLYFVKLKAALEELPAEALWAAPYPGGNSIGGITSHVCEHIARSCLRLTGLSSQLKPGFETYFPQRDLSPQELLNAFENSLNEWKSIMNQYIAKEMRLTDERIHELYHLVEHTGYHLGQIIDRAQGAKGNKLEFYRQGLNEAYLRGKIDSEEV